MGCCGKHRKMLQRSRRTSAPAPRGPMVSDPVSRSGVAPPAGGVRVTRSAGGGYTVSSKSGKSCPTCGTRTVVKHRYSDRLRRYYEAPWCSTCKADV